MDRDRDRIPNALEYVVNWRVLDGIIAYSWARFLLPVSAEFGALHTDRSVHRGWNGLGRCSSICSIWTGMDFN